MNADDLSIPIGTVDVACLLEDWNWLLRGGYRVERITLFGDLFLSDSEGAIHLLDMLSGETSRVADSISELASLLNQQDRLDEWFLQGFVMTCELRPAEGECLAWKIPPALGGPIEPDNLQVMSLRAYQRILSQLHEQIRDLPPGARISGFTVDGEIP